METTKQCLILAAGNGTRLRAISHGLPKPLVKFQGKPILQHIIERAEEAGISEFVIVVGYRSDLMREWVDSRRPDNVSVTLVENTEYHKSNGISALKAKNVIHGNFALLMADHLFEPDALATLLAQPLCKDEVILAVDPNIERVFDLDDATKVRRCKDRIIDIGKDISRYDALDTGMFLCTPVLFDKLEAAKRNGNCSLSDGMRQLAGEGKLRAFEIGDAQWQDLDTPEAILYAERAFDLPFATEQLTESLVNV